MAALHNVVYLTEAQYSTLKTNGTITVDGVTYTFNENDLYLTPQGNVLFGDGSDVTVAFSAASSRANISTGEKLSVIFGKIAKWFADLKSAAFRDATSSISSGSTALIESGAVFTALDGKQATITASGLLKGNGNGGVSAAVAGTDYQAPLVAGTDYATPGQIPSVPSAYTSNPAALGTASPGSSGSWARGDHVHPAELPTVTSSDNGKVLRVVSGAWAAASLPSAAGVSF